MKSYHDVGLKYDDDHLSVIFDAEIKRGEEVCFKDGHLGEKIYDRWRSTV